MALRREITAGAGERAVAQTHREDPREVPPNLRLAAGARRAHPRAGHGGQPQAGRPTDARGQIQGLYRRRNRGCTVRDPHADPYDDLVDRDFVVDGPNEIWCTDITEHLTKEGKVYCAAVIDVFSRRIVGWSIDDNMRTELVVDALGMAIP